MKKFLLLFVFIFSFLSHSADELTAGELTSYSANKLTADELTSYSANKLTADKLTAKGFTNEIHKAVLAKDINKVSEILERESKKPENDRIDINSKDEQGETALHYAIAKGRPKIVKLLLSYRADPNIRNREGRTALLLAYRKYKKERPFIGSVYPEIIELLLFNGADPKIGDFNGWTVLHLAAKKKDFKYAKFFLKKGAEPNATYTEDKYVDVTALHSAIKLYFPTPKGILEITELLLQNKADPNLQSNGGTALMIAYKEYLRSPFNGSVYSDVIDLLLEYQADPNIENSNGLTVLHLAALYEDSKMVKKFIENNANANSKYTYGKYNHATPLHTAVLKVKGKKTETLEDLLQHGVSPNKTKDDLGNTALHIASKYGKLEAVAVLLQYKADPNIKNKEGKIAFDLAFSLVPGKATKIKQLLQNATCKSTFTQ